MTIPRIPTSRVTPPKRKVTLSEDVARLFVILLDQLHFQANSPTFEKDAALVSKAQRELRAGLPAPTPADN